MIITELKENVQQIKVSLERIKELDQKIKRKENSLLRLKSLYESNLISEEEYKKVKESLEKEINSLKGKIREEAGRIKEIIDETLEVIKFYEGVEPIRKTHKETASSVYSIKKEFSKIIPIFEEYLVTYAPQQTKHEQPLPKFEKIKSEKSKVKLGKTALEFKKILRRKTPSKKYSVRKKVVKTYRKSILEKISIMDFIVKSANKFFGNLAENLLTSYPQLYVTIYNLLRAAGIKMLARTYLAVFLMIITLVLIFIICLSFLMFAVFGTISLPLFLFLLLGSVGITVFLIYYYPLYLRKSKAQEIESVLPFAIIHMAALSVSGIEPKDVFKIISEMEEYKSLADEFKKIVEYTEKLGMGLTDAIREVREETPSEELKEFFDGLVLSLTSGASFREFLEVSAESAIVHYKTQGQKFIQALKTFSDIYVGLVVTAPLILVSIIIMLASMTNQIFGISITTVVGIIVYLLTPLLNIAMILLITRIQPR